MISRQAFRGGEESIQVPQCHQQLNVWEMPWTAFFLKGWKTANGVLGYPGRGTVWTEETESGWLGLVGLRVGIQHTPALTSLSREVNCSAHMCPLRGWGWSDADERILNTPSLLLKLSSWWERIVKWLQRLLANSNFQLTQLLKKKQVTLFLKMTFLPGNWFNFLIVLKLL